MSGTEFSEWTLEETREDFFIHIPGLNRPIRLARLRFDENGNLQPVKEVEEVARAIAALPELVEALEEAVCLIGQMDHYLKGVPIHLAEQWKLQHKDISAALSKLREGSGT